MTIKKSKSKSKFKSNSEVGDFKITLEDFDNKHQYISIIDTTRDDSELVIWSSTEAFKLAYKLMSLASEMK